MDTEQAVPVWDRARPDGSVEAARLDVAPGADDAGSPAGVSRGIARRRLLSVLVILADAGTRGYEERVRG